MPTPETDTVRNAGAASLARPQGATIAYRKVTGAAPGIVFLGGFRSDMTGIKALFLEDYCRRNERAYVRFDYFGHGESSGDFAEGTVSRWRDDSLAVIDSLTEGPQILVGSSMGGWIMVLAALARPELVAGLIGIAAAPDATTDLMAARFTKEPLDARRSRGSCDPFSINRLCSYASAGTRSSSLP
jgi:pimeloyl-ACP methyl ester carboxylesterase